MNIWNFCKNNKVTDAVFLSTCIINYELEFISLQNLKNMFMKQMKFFLVALMAIVMGMSVTSCMNGDDNTQVNDLPVLGKVKR